MKTIIQIEIDHEKELPKDITDQAANRVWNYLQNLGYKHPVTASRELVEKVQE